MAALTRRHARETAAAAQSRTGGMKVVKDGRNHHHERRERKSWPGRPESGMRAANETANSLISRTLAAEEDWPLLLVLGRMTFPSLNRTGV